MDTDQTDGDGGETSGAAAATAAGTAGTDAKFTNGAGGRNGTKSGGLALEAALPIRTSMDECRNDMSIAERLSALMIDVFPKEISAIAALYVCLTRTCTAV